MINTSGLPVLTDSSIAPGILDKLIRDALSGELTNKKTSDCNLMSLERDKYGLPTFYYFFKSELKNKQQFNLEWIYNVFKFTQDKKNPKNNPAHTGLENILTCGLESYKKYCTKRTSRDARHLICTKTALKKILVQLWAQDIILLPLTSLFGSSDVYCKELPENKELLRDTLSYANKSVRSRAIRILLATNWNTIEDVNLNEYSMLHKVTLRNSSPEIDVKGVAKWPFIPLLNMLMELYGKKAQHISKDFESYKRWSKGRYYKDYEFNYFNKNFESIRAEQRQKYNNQKAIAHRKKALSRHLNSQVIPNESLKEDDTYLTVHLKHIAEKHSHESAVEYFVTLAKKKTFPQKAKTKIPVSYPGREHIKIDKLGQTWETIFESFIHTMIYDRGLEYLEGIKTSLNLLRDYLYLYLPWWFELNYDKDLDYPSNPLDFKRSYFWRRSKRTTSLPIPMYELLTKRRQGGGVGSVVSTVHKLFEYICTHKDEFNEFTDKPPHNPVSIEFDYPRLSHRHKSNKISFHRRHMPFLYRYVYAIEKFGRYLQHLTMKNTHSPPLSNSRGAHREFIDPQDFGYSLSFDFNGQNFPIDLCPPVFNVSKRQISHSDAIVTVNIPHLSALRVCILILETGIRKQHLQWLDINKWDSLNSSKSHNSYFLFVNTDKTKDGPWGAPMMSDLREILKHEEAFQQSIQEPQMSFSYTYEYRKKSRFPDITPLFRGTSSMGKVINDKAIDNTWLQLMIGFQIFYNRTVATTCNQQINQLAKLFDIQPKIPGNNKATFIKTRDGEKQVVEDILMETINVGMKKPETIPKSQWPKKISYCLLAYYPIHTPHAARKTFASRRSAILEITDIQKMLGHQNESVTLYYTVEDDEELFEKAANARAEIFNYTPEIKRIHLHPESPDSSTRRAVLENVDDAIRSYGFQIISLMNENPEPEHDGIALLRTTPASRLEFQPTHICITGGHCPSDIMDIIHQPRRCGLCPIAVKGVDHLTGIAAKINQLTEQVYHANCLLSEMQKKIKEKSVNESHILHIEDQRRWDLNELLGWKRSYDLLMEFYKKRVNEDSNDPNLYTVDQPEIVKRHLREVVQNTDQSKFILDRIIDSEAYPYLQTAELRAKVEQFKRKILVNNGMLIEALADAPTGNEIEELRSLVVSISRTLQCSPSELLKRYLIQDNGMVTSQLETPAIFKKHIS